jgi:hypothetical protein
MPDMEEDNFEKLGDAVNDRIKAVTQEAVSDTQGEFDDIDNLGDIFRPGARVISIEGEAWKEGMIKVEGRGRLGWLTGVDEWFDGFRIKFVKKYFYQHSKRPLPRKERIPHPLSMRKFYVPREGGVMVLDDGALVLVSKTGLFRGQGGWAQARHWRELYVKEFNRNHSIHDQVEYTTSQLTHTETQLLKLQVSKDALTIWAMQKEDEGRNARDTMNKLRQNNLSLYAQLESIHGINVNEKRIVRETLKEMQCQVTDLQAYVVNERTYEALQMAGSDAPDVRAELKNKLLNKWRQTGIVPEDKTAKEVAELHKKFEQQEKKIAELLKEREQKKEDKGAPPQQPSPPPTGDDGEGEGGDDEIDDEEPDDSKPQPQSPASPKEEKTDEAPKGFLEKIKAVGQDSIASVKKAIQRTPKKEEKEPEQSTEEKTEEPADESGSGEGGGDEGADEGTDEEE